MRLLILIIISINMCGNITIKEDKNKIYWDKNKPLTWKDFQGKVSSKTATSVAYTTVDFKYSVLTKHSIQVSNCFLKDQSWVKKHYQLQEILAHEQYHFNISEVFARRMRKEMETVTFPSTKNVQQIFDHWIKKYNAEQELYDKETSHSQIEAEQLRWQKKIDNELIELEAYKDQIVNINYINPNQ
jgi:hypothetical protein